MRRRAERVLSCVWGLVVVVEIRVGAGAGAHEEGGPNAGPPRGPVTATTPA